MAAAIEGNQWCRTDLRDSTWKIVTAVTEKMAIWPPVVSYCLQRVNEFYSFIFILCPHIHLPTRLPVNLCASGPEDIISCQVVVKRYNFMLASNYSLS